MNIRSILWLVPLLPALGAAANGLRAVLSQETKNKKTTNAIALGSTFFSAAIATWVVVDFIANRAREAYDVVYYDWIPAGLGHVIGAAAQQFSIPFAFRIDALSCTMLMVVCWVGFLIHVYATGYMSHERGYTRFFTYLNLFMFMMLLLVLGNNYVVMFVGWEGVGLCSYLLIGFYYDKTFAADAGKKAFITNRIGDFGFLLGIFTIFATFGTVNYADIFATAAANPEHYAGPATLICLLLFVGACGKSAQVPLYVWLPDAMAGPTPVSALIHAATMVTAGVYMVVRSNVLYRLSPTAMAVVAITGAVTAIFAATIGIAQNDIKKVLAYSTVSQLGFMFLGAGVGAFVAAIFHLMTHAFFKACLFLGAGSVIHGCNGEQDMRRMGGLRKYMPTTRWTFLVATIAIAGIPPLAGFFSKDEILASAFFARFAELGSPWSSVPLVCWALGVIAATFTAFYMFRLYFMTFSHDYRGAISAGTAESEPSHGGHTTIDAHTTLASSHAPGQADDHAGHAAHPHESPKSMTGVLAALAVLAAIGGFVGIPLGAFGIHGPNLFHRWLEPVLLPIAGHGAHEASESLAMEWTLIGISVAVAALGIAIAYVFYFKDLSWSRPRKIAESFGGAYRLVLNKYYVDEIYQATVIRGTIVFSNILAWIDTHIVDGVVNGVRHVTVWFFGEGSNLVDKYIVDGAVNGVGMSARGSSRLLRRMQSGFVQNYALIMGGGIVLFAAVYFFTKP